MCVVITNCLSKVKHPHKSTKYPNIDSRQLSPSKDFDPSSFLQLLHSKFILCFNLLCFSIWLGSGLTQFYLKIPVRNHLRRGEQIISPKRLEGFYCEAAAEAVWLVADKDLINGLYRSFENIVSLVKGSKTNLYVTQELILSTYCINTPLIFTKKETEMKNNLLDWGNIAPVNNK